MYGQRHKGYPTQIFLLQKNVLRNLCKYELDSSDIDIGKIIFNALDYKCFLLKHFTYVLFNVECFNNNDILQLIPKV